LESDLEESKRRFRVTWTDMRAKLTEADIEAAGIRLRTTNAARGIAD